MDHTKITEDMLKPEKIQSQVDGHSVELEVLVNLGATITSFKVDGN